VWPLKRAATIVASSVTPVYAASRRLALLPSPLSTISCSIVVKSQLNRERAANFARDFHESGHRFSTCPVALQLAPQLYQLIILPPAWPSTTAPSGYVPEPIQEGQDFTLYGGRSRVDPVRSNIGSVVEVKKGMAHPKSTRSAYQH
jgi:hypothetical protein